jgi:hypothetical protein
MPYLKEKHNPTYIILGVLIMVACTTLVCFGLHRYVVPFFKKRLSKEVKGNKIAF